jgi:hypothetical protein
MNKNNNTGTRESIPKTLGNKIAETTTSNNATGTTLATTPVLEQEEKINPVETKNIALSGKDAEDMRVANEMNPDKKEQNNEGVYVNKNRTKKRNNIRNQNLTQKKTVENNDNESTTKVESTNNTVENKGSDDTEKGKMRSLNNIAMNLLNHQIVLKLFHFQTELYGAHKASDNYLEKFAGTMDKFLEIAQGIYGRITIKKYTLNGSSHNDDNIVKHLDGVITLLRENIEDILDNYTDLINVRDELVGDAEQLKYLLTFK